MRIQWWIKIAFYFLLGFQFSCRNTEDKSQSVEVLDQIEPYKKFVSAYLSDHSEYSDSLAFLVDFSVSSGKNRFYVWQIAQDSIVDRGLVTRGSCRGKTAPKGAKYSNIPNSYCSSLGLYKVGQSYQGDFGLAYKLHGLDSTNSNAYGRFIVLHGHQCVPTTEFQVSSLCMSQGCPTVAPQFLQRLAQQINQSSRPIVLYQFDQNETILPNQP